MMKSLLEYFLITRSV